MFPTGVWKRSSDRADRLDLLRASDAAGPVVADPLWPDSAVSFFDINDFDEASPAPWEWDVKRLVARATACPTPMATTRRSPAHCYREHMRAYAQMRPIEVWYARVDSEDFLTLVSDAGLKGRVRKRIAKSKTRGGSEIDLPQLADMVGAKSAFMTKAVMPRLVSPIRR